MKVSPSTLELLQRATRRLSAHSPRLAAGTPLRRWNSGLAASPAAAAPTEALVIHPRELPLTLGFGHRCGQARRPSRQTTLS